MMSSIAVVTAGPPRRRARMRAPGQRVRPLRRGSPGSRCGRAHRATPRGPGRRARRVRARSSRLRSSRSATDVAVDASSRRACASARAQPVGVAVEADAAPTCRPWMSVARRSRSARSQPHASRDPRPPAPWPAVSRRVAPVRAALLDRRSRSQRVERIRRAPREDERLEQRVRGEAVRAVHAGARDLPDGEQARAARCGRRRRCGCRPSSSARPASPESARRPSRSRARAVTRVMPGEALGEEGARRARWHRASPADRPAAPSRPRCRGRRRRAGRARRPGARRT